MSLPESDVAALAEALAAHEYTLGLKRGTICICGHIPTVVPESLATQQDYHRAHVAEALAPVVEAIRDRAARDALLAAADVLDVRRPIRVDQHNEGVLSGLERAENLLRARAERQADPA